MPFNYGGMEPKVRIELTATFLPRRQSTIDLQRHVLEPLRGIEPRLTDYKTVVLPLDDSGLRRRSQHQEVLFDPGLIARPDLAMSGCGA